jgi:hypothetical protein
VIAGVLRLQQTLANFGIAFLFGATGIGAMPLRSARRPYLAGIGGQLAAVHSAAKLNHRSFFAKGRKTRKKTRRLF